MSNEIYQVLSNFLKEHNFQRHIDKLAQKYKDKKVIIYGAGMFFDVIAENFNLSKINIIGISDIKFNNTETNKDEPYKDYKIIKPTEIASHNPDIVLVALQEVSQIESYFKNNLFENKIPFKCEPILSYSIPEFIANNAFLIWGRIAKYCKKSIFNKIYK